MTHVGSRFVLTKNGKSARSDQYMWMHVYELNNGTLKGRYTDADGVVRSAVLKRREQTMRILASFEVTSWQ